MNLFAEYSDKELELAVDYLDRKINEIQLNFLLVQNKIEPERIDKLINSLRGGYNKFYTYEICFLILLACFLIILIASKNLFI